MCHPPLMTHVLTLCLFLTEAVFISRHGQEIFPHICHYHVWTQVNWPTHQWLYSKTKHIKASQGMQRMGGLYKTITDAWSQCSRKRTSQRYITNLGSTTLLLAVDSIWSFCQHQIRRDNRWENIRGYIFSIMTFQIWHKQKMSSWHREGWKNADEEDNKRVTTNGVVLQDILLGILLILNTM